MKKQINLKAMKKRKKQGEVKTPEKREAGQRWKHLAAAACLLALLQACEHELPFRYPENDARLIMNALLEAERDTNYVLLHLGRPDVMEKLEEASVTLSVNGGAAERAREIVTADTTDDVLQGDGEDGESQKAAEAGKRFVLTSSFRPGDRLRLEAVAEEGKYRVAAEVTVPQPLPAFRIDTAWTYVYENNYRRKKRQYSLTLQDIPDEDSYYRLEWWDDLATRYILDIPGAAEWGGEEHVEQLFTERKSEIDTSRDVILNDGQPVNNDDADFGILFPVYANKYRIFSDARFKNSEATLKVLTPSYEHYLVGGGSYNTGIIGTHSATIRLLSLTKDYYDYLRSLNIMESDDYEETIMEPVCLPCNVEGGLGFVGVCSVTTQVFRLPDWKEGFD